ncbi:MAG: hypothetical protein EX271_00665 [Acidimicrobiales bacterium]|nr:hypothetical protein [Hyphomonadaceae bacterium]RZV44920.1 MAG: hypothetical protein EX271_00665 [Acidimicrobiales bacterium]
MQTETIGISFTTGSDPVRTVSPIDENHLLYGNFLGVQYVFKDALDPECLAGALYDLFFHYPALAGVYNQTNSSIIEYSDGIKLQVIEDIRGSFTDHCKFGTVQSDRSNFVDEPNRRDVLGGKANLTSCKLSIFKDGGCNLGLAISHVLVDAAGFHLLANQLARFYTHRSNKTEAVASPAVYDLDVFTFGTDRSRSETIAALDEADLKKPMKIRGLIGGLLKNIIVKALDGMAKNNRVVIHFTANDVARLKQKVLEESSEDWISTNVALSAHFTKIMAMLMYGDKPKSKVQIGQLLDLRGRYFDQNSDQQNDYVGNAILIHTSKPEFADGIQNTSRGSLAKWFKSNLSGINADYLKTRLDLIADCLRLGYSYPGLELKDPMIALNNQSKMPVYDLEFGGNAPQRVIPQDVGDNIMFFPTPDGGIEIYIRDILNPKRQQLLLTNEWQAKIFDF